MHWLMMMMQRTGNKKGEVAGYVSSEQTLVLFDRSCPIQTPTP